MPFGKDADGQIRAEMGLYDDPELQRYVSDVGLRLASLSHRPNLPWTFTIVDVPAINAFALPGGYIYITRGILPYLDDEAELAGVLGHEVGHVTARNTAQRYDQAQLGQLGAVAAQLGGMLLGVLVIVAAWVLTWVYVRWANTHYDASLRGLKS